MNNFNLLKEIADQSDKDWKFGASSQPGIVSIPLAERENWLPAGELQYDSQADFTDCASRSPVNHYEALFTYHYQHDMLPANKQWLQDNGYVYGGRVTFSDRFIAILSGTTREGNSLKAPLETIRTRGLIPKQTLPKLDTMSFDDYYRVSDIVPAMTDLGLEFLKRFTLNYDQVSKDLIKVALKNDMLGVAGFAWPLPVNGVYPAQPDLPFNHAFLIFNEPDFQIYDNYYDSTDSGQLEPGDFTKSLAPDYVFWTTAYRAYIGAETVPVDQSIMQSVLAALASNGLLSFFADWLKRFTQTNQITTMPENTPAVPVHTGKIPQWAAAIEKQEGGKPNDLNMRLNNPGNLKFTKYTESLGAKQASAATDGGTFCTWPTHEAGMKALCQFLTDACHNQLVAFHDKTLGEFTQIYAHPPSDAYGNNVAAELGVSIDIPIKELL